GAEIKLSTKFLDFKNMQVITSNGNYQTKLLVGADGPNSTVARVSGLELPDNFLKAAQVRAKSNFDSNVVELWFGNDIAPGLFAWVVPENEEIARVGLMTEKNPNEYIEKFSKNRLGNVEITDRIGDFGKYGLIRKSVSNNTLLVGDAACQIKPFSMGGIVYGQIGAEYAGKSLIKSLQSNDFSESFLERNYDKKWKKDLAGPIRKGLLMKKIFSSALAGPRLFGLIQMLGIKRLSSLLDMDFLGKS
ncbi:MAG TPA: NAD(P)/FAD-dependent oxidoreductase, partial [archaeon]|nr:NAD(P)/FAD-dependent oxidoreductase [archaeon]